MSKIIFALLVLISVVSYGTSLTCYECDTDARVDCKNPKTDSCRNDQEKCATLAIPDQKYYFKGCMKEKKSLCEKKNKKGEKKFPICEFCDKDNCNSKKFE
ncbi:uncharacterized protein LOC123307587 [Coccinella septempunctata]|uniref:uncharacterized protein LOC123307587 n=1 Tax=Coccinella septempunctata TaxID=41139 RepID=UPI001D096506|nr:uncharacterized protein LOC123307587 [Coccinella septempunctata]